MIEFLLTFIILVAITAGMAVGVLRGRKPIAGTCGGLNNMGEQGACDLCGGDTRKCDSLSKPAFYDAS